jgi:hypothetical protein
MERKNTIKISFEPSYFSQIFIHTSGSYMRTLVNKNNNRYLSNFKDDWYDEEFEELILELENGPSESRKQEILSRLKILANTQTRVNPIPLSFDHNIEELYGYIVFEPTSSIEHYDLALLDFISYDFNVFNDYLLFFINFFDYFINKLDEKDINYIKLDTLYPIDEIIEIARKYYNEEKENLIYYQSLFKQCINFVYDIDNPFDMKHLTHKQIFYLYNQIYSNVFSEFKKDFHSVDILDYQYLQFPFKPEDAKLENINNLIDAIGEADPSGRKLVNLNRFETNNLFTSFYITLFNVVSVNSVYIKICGNCGRYFITHKKNISYCDRQVAEYVTCKDIGNKEYQKRKLENDSTYDKYRKIGSRKQLRASRNPEIEMYQNDLKQYRKIGKQMYKDVCDGKISNEEFAKWVDEQDK